MKNGVFVTNNIRWNTKVCYSIEETNEFLKNNTDYALLDTDDDTKVYHCALKIDDGEVHDPKLNKYIK